MNSSTLLRGAALAGALAAGAAAQSNVAVFPSDHTGATPGTTLAGDSFQLRFPFSAGISRQMALYDSLDLMVPNGRQITHVGFPADDARSSTGQRVQLEILMGHTTNDVASADRTFANNYASGPTVVYTQKILTLPNLSPGGAVWVPLDTPFTVDRSRNLIVEYRVTANNNSNAAFNYFLDAGNFISEVRSYGVGCATSGGSVPRLTSTGTAIGETWRMRIDRAAASSQISLLVGISRPANPIPLDAVGAPGCFLLTDVLATAGGTSGTSGVLDLNFPTPFDPTIIDQSLYSQAVVLDLFANNLGAVTSNGDDMEFGLRSQLALISAIGDASAPTGSVSRNNTAFSLFGYN